MARPNALAVATKVRSRRAGGGERLILTVFLRHGPWNSLDPRPLLAQGRLTMRFQFAFIDTALGNADDARYATAHVRGGKRDAAQARLDDGRLRRRRRARRLRSAADRPISRSGSRRAAEGSSAGIRPRHP